MTRKTHAERLMNRCKHFTGLQHDACAAGVAYADVKNTDTKPFRWPCFADEGANLPCAKREFPTREEAEAEEREFQRAHQNVLTARRAIVAHTNGARGVGGEIVCPVDGGTLRFSVSGYNGHIHAACSNPECVRWME